MTPTRFHARLRRWREAPAVYALVYHPAVAVRAKPARRRGANGYTVAKWAGGGGGGSRRARRPRGRQAFAASTRSTTAAVCSMSPSSTSRCVTKRTVHGPVSYTHLRAHETDSYLVCRLLL